LIIYLIREHFCTVLVLKQHALALVTSSDNVMCLLTLIRINMKGHFCTFVFLFFLRSSISAEPRVADEQESIWKRNNIYEGITLRAYFCIFLWLWMFWDESI